MGIPNIGWTVSWVQLENTEEYKGKALLERVLIGDTVSVHFPAMQISVAARAVEITYDTLLERYKDIRLGSVKASIANEIVSQGKDIAAKPSKSDMQSAILQMTNTLTGSAGGAVRLLDTNGDGNPDTLYIADDPDPDKAVKVWRFNYRGWGASETGYNGLFTMGATFDDGFLADFIRAGTLNADLIKTGILQSKDGRFSLNLETGQLTLSGFATEDQLEAAKDEVTQDIKENGVPKVDTGNGNTLDRFGLRIAKPGEEMENLLDNTGMYVSRSGEGILAANNQGVNALNLTARQYLIVGQHARFEDYTEGRTACFWI